MPINVFIRQVCCSGTLQAVLQASLINIQRHKTIKAPGSIQSITHSLIIIARASLIYIYYYYYTKKITKTNKTVMCMQGEGRNIHCIALFKLFGCSHPPVPTHRIADRTQPIFSKPTEFSAKPIFVIGAVLSNTLSYAYPCPDLKRRAGTQTKTKHVLVV